MLMAFSRPKSVRYLASGRPDANQHQRTDAADRSFLTENRDRVYHAAMMDPHTAPCWALTKYMLLLTT